jgi:6-phosphofructokinase
VAKRTPRYIGVLTAGGDTPGLNAALRAIGKAAESRQDMRVIGFRDGFKGLMENRYLPLGSDVLSGILTVGGTILGTSREKPHAMLVGGAVLDVTPVIVENYHQHHLDALICLGGGGTQKNAYRLAQAGLNIITLPKTMWRAPTSASVSTPRSASPPRLSTACTALLTATTASSSWS